MRKIVYFSLTSGGDALTLHLSKELPGERVTKQTLEETGLHFVQSVRQAWKKADGLVFVMACGIVVRAIAPLLRSKAEDPAVVVMDVQGQFAISLLSGHLGGANALAKQLAAISKGLPVITTGTDVEGTLAFDLFAQEQDLRIENLDALKAVSAAMIEGESVCLYSSWTIPMQFPANVKVQVGMNPSQQEQSAVQPDSQNILQQSGQSPSRKKVPWVWIGHRFEEKEAFLLKGQEDPVKEAKEAATDEAEKETKKAPVLYLRPRNLYLGIGCQKGISPEVLKKDGVDFLRAHQIEGKDLAGMATLALKAQEPAILEFAKEYGCRLRAVENAQIEPLEGKGILKESAFVRQTVGVGSVCEGSALVAAAFGCAYGKEKEKNKNEAKVLQYLEKGYIRLVVSKTKYPGVTFAMAECIPWKAGRGKDSCEYTVDWSEP